MLMSSCKSSSYLCPLEGMRSRTAERAAWKVSGTSTARGHWPRYVLFLCLLSMSPGHDGFLLPSVGAWMPPHMALCRPRPLDHFSVLSACGNLKFAVAQTRRARSYGTWWALAANGESSRDQAARNQAVKQKLMELEKLRSSIASKKGVSDVEAAEEVARVSSKASVHVGNCRNPTQY